jgi:ribokinase
MSGVVITGYASLDHVVTLGGDIVYGRTTTISDRPDGAWPRLGGGPAYVAAAIRSRYDGPVVPVSWVGQDALGDSYREQLQQQGISSQGMAKIAGARTPVSMLIYNPVGDCACLYDPGMSAETQLSEHQRHLVAAASLVCITIGPRGVTSALLSSLHDDQMLAWIVKNDPQALSLDQAERLAERSDIIFCNSRERTFLASVLANVAEPRANQWIVETQGQRGALFEHGGKSYFVPAKAVTVRDPTGAGDTFAGGVLAAILNGETDPKELGRCGNEAAQALLATRISEQERE